MSFFSSNKIKSYSHDIAPIGFYFDFFSTEIFSIPIMPIPMRIDKITNGDPTLFIIPDIQEIQTGCEKINIYIDFKNFLFFGLKNLLEYTKSKFKEINRTYLDENKIKEWYRKSLILETEILGLKKDFTFLYMEFLKLFSTLQQKDLSLNSKNYKVELITYCDTIVEYFRKRIYDNYIEIKTSEGNIEKKEIYEKKRGKYYPQLIHFEVQNYEEKGKKKKKGFIPYLLYDDLAEVFFYNKQLLSGDKMDAQTPIDLNIYREKGIITSEARSLNFRGSFPSINQVLRKLS
jgi:hypothetical protein